MRVSCDVDTIDKLIFILIVYQTKDFILLFWYGWNHFIRKDVVKPVHT